MFWEAVPDEDDTTEEAEEEGSDRDSAGEVAEGFVVKLSDSPEAVVSARDRNQI